MSKVRNHVVLAMIRSGKSSVAHKDDFRDNLADAEYNEQLRDMEEEDEHYFGDEIL